MSGRSAYVRKKGPEKNSKGKAPDTSGPAYPQQPPLHHYADPRLLQQPYYPPPPNAYSHPHQISQYHAHPYGPPAPQLYPQQHTGYPMPGYSRDYNPPSASLGTGIATSNARFLQFTEASSPPSQDDYGNDFSSGAYTHGYDPYAPSHRQLGQTYASQAGSGGSLGSGSDEPRSPPQAQAMKTEDVSGIERSGLRTLMDKRSDGVRRGLAKTFAFRNKKDKLDEKRLSVDDKSSSSPGTISSGTIRQFEAALNSTTARRPTTTISPPETSASSVVGSGSNGDDSGPLGWSPQATIHHLDNSTTFAPDDANQFSINVRTSIQTQPPPFVPQLSPERLTTDLRGMHPPPQPLPPTPARTTVEFPQPPSGPPLSSSPSYSTPNLQIKRWVGNGKPPSKWNKLRRDPELWDPNGDVLIYLAHKGESPRPSPSFRVSSHVIEATGSRNLTTMLVEASGDDTAWPASVHPQHRHRYTGGKPANKDGPVPNIFPREMIGEDGIESEDDEESDNQASALYEMYFPPPYGLSPAMTLRHHITTRNVLALLYHASLVGTTMYTALTDLLERLDNIMPSGSDNVGLVLGHVLSRGLDDVRGDTSAAVSLMAWCEHASVRWEEGWIEFFAHTVGMYQPDNMDLLEDWKWVSLVTRAMVDGAALEEQVRVQSAEDRLADFNFGDLWRKKGHKSSAMAKAAGERLSRMLIEYYTNVFGEWPPPARAIYKSAKGTATGRDEDNEYDEDDEDDESDDVWLTRLLAMGLEKDFGVLYEYLVDRTIQWSTEGSGGKKRWKMTRSSQDDSDDNDDDEDEDDDDEEESSDDEEVERFSADVEGFPMTDIILDYDNAAQYPHIPHPFPLIPKSVSPKGRGNPERRIHLAYMEASNVDALQQGQQSDLVDAFMRFEKSDHLADIDPSVARRGRWVVIYGILQTLASVSVDAKEVRWREGVDYHLCVRFGGKGRKIPPWRLNMTANGGSRLKGAQHEASLCWNLSKMWAGEKGKKNTEGGGAKRGEGERQDEVVEKNSDKEGGAHEKDSNKTLEKGERRRRRGSSVGSSSIPSTTPSMTPDTASLSRSSSLARARSFSHPSRGRARTRSSEALPSPKTEKSVRSAVPANPSGTLTAASPTRAPSVISSIGSVFDPSDDWEGPPSVKGKAESRGSETKKGKRNTGMPMLQKVEQLRSESRTRPGYAC